MCIPKWTRSTHPADFRPITLLNTVNKILARIIASKIRPALEELLRTSQYCGVPGKIFEAVANVKDAITNAEVAQIHICVLSLDFKEAFDKISHTYPFTILQNYGFFDVFIERIKEMYDNAASVVQINRHFSCPTPIPCSVRQGCLLSMLLFALCLTLLLHRMEQHLGGIWIHRRQKSGAVAYADHDTIFVTAPEDISATSDAIQ